MTPAPGWFVGVCWVVAVACSLATGLQYGSDADIAWPVLLAAGALAAAVLPQRRLCAVATAAIGALAGLWGAWLIRHGAELSGDDLVAVRGAAGRVVASGVMLATSLLRALWA